MEAPHTFPKRRELRHTHRMRTLRECDALDSISWDANYSKTCGSEELIFMSSAKNVATLKWTRVGIWPSFSQPRWRGYATTTNRKEVGHQSSIVRLKRVWRIRDLFSPTSRQFFGGKLLKKDNAAFTKVLVVGRLVVRYFNYSSFKDCTSSRLRQNCILNISSAAASFKRSVSNI